MSQVKITDVRAHLAEYLARAILGEPITVMSRGTPIAKLVPAGEPPGTARERLVSTATKLHLDHETGRIGNYQGFLSSSNRRETTD